MPNFLQALHSGRTLLLDGAMGTELQRAGLQPGECYELWNLTHPERVHAIHQAYLDAGAECLLTNTFQANPVALGRFGLAEQLEPINRAGVQLARGVRGNPFVLASIGPLDLSAGTDGLERVIRSLDGVDGFLLETWSADFALAVRRATDPLVNPERLPVLLSLTFSRQPGSSQPPCLHPSGLMARETAKLASALGLAALGVNCGREITLTDMNGIVAEYRAATNLPLLARPNAGTPILAEGRWVYPHFPQKMAAGAPALLAAGVQLLGGCCGTTPAHIAAFRAAIERFPEKSI